MARLLIGTDGPATSERIVDYLVESCDQEDELYILNSLVGGDATTADDIADGEAALDVLEEGLGEIVVERDQMVRGNEPVEDLLAAADEWGADEYVLGIRKRSPVGKVVFGSTAQNLLLEADRPVRCVPLVKE
jgi:nucleotide-binding universal stress UspA family protein